MCRRLPNASGIFAESFRRSDQSIHRACPSPAAPFPTVYQPVGRAIAALYPLPNRNVPFLNFVSSPTQRDHNDIFDVRVDHRLTDNADLGVPLQFR